MILGIHDWPMFIAAGLLLNLTPGADMALVSSRSASGGFRAGAAAALGVGAGCSVHIAAGALGVSALLAGSSWAFGLLRWLGAAYLVWLGVGLWRQAKPPSRRATAHADATAKLAADLVAGNRPSPHWRPMFMQGFLTNALNPKVALFFLAFVPQFIAAGSAHQAWAFVALGSVFVVSGTLVNLALAGLVSAGAAALQPRPGLPGQPARWRPWLQRLAGAVFIGLGLKLAASNLG